MARRRVTFRPLAEADLFDLYRHIAQEAGHHIAGGYIDRLETACMALETFPHRGHRRDDLRPGLRIIGFERRASIAFQVPPAEVVIVRISFGGRDYESILGRAGG